MYSLFCGKSGCEYSGKLSPDKTKPVRVITFKGGGFIVGYPFKRERYCYYHDKEVKGHFNTKNWRLRRKQHDRESIPRKTASF